MMVKCLAGNNTEAHSTIGGIADTGKVTPTIVAPNDPNMETKPIIDERCGFMLKMNTDTDKVAATNNIELTATASILPANGICTNLNKTILAKTEIAENAKK